MKNLFVPYSIARALKDKGFDETCLGIIWDDKTPDKNTLHTGSPELISIMLEKDKTCIPAPLYQQVVDWFREEHNIWIYPTPQFDGVNWQFHIWIYTKDDVFDMGICFRAEELYNQLDAAINHAITLLP